MVLHSLCIGGGPFLTSLPLFSYKIRIGLSVCVSWYVGLTDHIVFAYWVFE